MSGKITCFPPLVKGKIGFLTGRSQVPCRSYYRTMDLEGVLSRIERRLDALQITANAASKAAGKPDAIRNLRRAVENKSRKGISTATVAALAPILKTTSTWLMEGTGEEEPDSNPDANTVPLVGYVGAGAARNMFSTAQGELDRVPAPDGATDKTVAVEVRGTSLGELFDQWLVYYDEIHDPPTSSMIGRTCVVGLADGSVLVKQLHRGQIEGRYTLKSNTEPPIYDAEVVWAARVKQMTPR